MEEETAVRIELSGDLDLYRREQISAALPPVDNIDRVIIDMRAATLIDSSIIALLMRYRRSFMDAGKEGHDIVLVIPPIFRRVFEITGLVKLLTIVTAPVSGEPVSDEPVSDEPLTEA